MPEKKFIIIGGAGFIGSHFIAHLLEGHKASAVTIYDNFSSGREWHYQEFSDDPRLNVVRGDVKELESLKSAMDGHDVVIHLASNPDIAKAATEPTIDFVEGTLLTQNVIEAMRCTSAKTILYASGSGVYGDLGELEADEDYGPAIPISTYGASKLAGEALIASYTYMFDLTGCAFRFGNVVGPRQTHGVGYDFLRSLLADPTSLAILGNGTQSKSYIHVHDVIAAVMLALEKSQKSFDVFNVATGDYITVKEIADIAVKCVGLTPEEVNYQFAGGDRGWKGDVPIVRLNTDRIKKLGWKCRLGSAEALESSIKSMANEIKDGKMGENN